MSPVVGGKVGRVVLVAVLLVASLAVPFYVTGHYNRNVLNLSLIYVLLVLGFNYTFGYTGQLSLGHIGFFGIGAYASALMTTDAKMAPLIGLVAGVCAAALAALVLARLTSRLHSHYLALATLGFGQIVQVVLLNWRDVTHGASGVLRIPPLAIGPFAARDDIGVYFAILSVVLLGLLVAWRFQSSRLGRAARLMKQSEVAAEAVGIPTIRLKMIALVISAVHASLAGALYAHAFGFISPDVFSFSLMITILAMLVLGGQGTISGAIVGAVSLTFLPEWLRDFGRYWLLAYGIGILLMVVYMPYGAVGILGRLFDEMERVLNRSEPTSQSGTFPPVQSDVAASIERDL